MISSSNRGSFYLLPVLYPLVTMLPMILFLYNRFGDYTYIRGLYFLSILILATVITPIFRSYCIKNKFQFENQSAIISNWIIVISIVVGLTVTFFQGENKMFSIILGLPLILIIFFNYILTGLLYLKDEVVIELVKVVNIHLRSTIRIININIVVKLSIITIFVLCKLWDNSIFYPAIISFISDILLIIYLRRILYKFYLRQEGGGVEFNLSSNWLFYLLGTMVVSIFSFIFSRDWSILSYKSINTFLKWLSNLAKDNSSKGYIEPVDSLGNNMPNFTMLQRFVNEERDGVLLDTLWFYTEKIGLVLILLFTLFILFKPLIVPLFTREKVKISLVGYYKGLWSKILNYISNLKEDLLKLFSRDNYQTSYEVMKYNREDRKIKIKPKDIKKVKEVQRLMKLYLKLVKSFGNKRRSINWNRSSITEFFKVLESHIGLDPNILEELKILFNKGFFSYELLLEKEYRDIKKAVAEIVKSKNN